MKTEAGKGKYSWRRAESNSSSGGGRALGCTGEPSGPAGPAPGGWARGAESALTAVPSARGGNSTPGVGFCPIIQGRICSRRADGTEAGEETQPNPPRTPASLSPSLTSSSVSGPCPDPAHKAWDGAALEDESGSRTSSGSPSELGATKEHGRDQPQREAGDDTGTVGRAQPVASGLGLSPHSGPSLTPAISASRSRECRQCPCPT